jgi:zinc and cadmium transporter
LHVAPIQSFWAVVGVQVLAAAAVVSLHRSDRWLQRALPYVISTAVGVLLATGAAHLLPEAVEALGNRSALWVTLVLTMLGLYIFERLFQIVSGVRAEPLPEALAESPSEPTAEPSHDCDDEHPHGVASESPIAALGHHHHHGATRPATLLLGSFLHSLVDGTGIAAAFAVDPRVGWVTALAVGLHEIPHRLGDFALLVHMGIARGRAAWLAIAAGASSLLGWAVVAALGSGGSQQVAWLLPVSAGSFLYISLVDLLPELQAEHRTAAVLGQIVCLAGGIALGLGLTHMRGA